MRMKKLNLGGRAIIAGPGSLDYVRQLTAAKAFIVTGGSSMRANGTIERIERMLQDNNCETYVYSGIRKNPDTDAVLDGVARMREFAPDLLIAVGGGSAIDAAKVMGIFYEYPEYNFANVLTSTLPEVRNKLQLVAIPSTSGTGTEVTRAAVITFREQNLKIGLKAESFIPDIAILDADITLTMPANVVAETGMDAMTHAVECYISHALDAFIEPLAKGAVAGLFTYLPASFYENTIESRDKVHLYQCMAGIAFDNTGLGLAHGIAHAVGGKFDLAHGLLNAVVLPYVLEYNAQDSKVQEKLECLAAAIGEADFIEAIRKLNQTLKVPTSLRGTGLLAEDFENAFEELVANSLKGSTQRNPMPIDEETMAVFLRNVYEGKSWR